MNWEQLLNITNKKDRKREKIMKKRLLVQLPGLGKLLVVQLVHCRI